MPPRGRTRPGLAPSEHLVDCAYVSAGHLVSARTLHGIDLVGPGHSNVSWQSRSGGDAFTLTDFTVDRDRKAMRCPEGKESGLWISGAKHRGQGSVIHVQLRAAYCRACLSRARCTRARSKCQGQVLAVMPRPEHKALAAARAREGTAEGKGLYAQSNGVEGTLSQAVRGFGLRQARYRGLVRWTPARADMPLALRRARRVMADFANRGRSFDEVVQAVRLVSRTLPQSWRGAWHHLARPRSRGPRSPARSHLAAQVPGRFRTGATPEPVLRP